VSHEDPDNVPGAAAYAGRSVATRASEVELRGSRFCEQAPGAIALDVAENVLIDDLLEAALNGEYKFDRSDFQYAHTSVGSHEVRQGIAALLSDSFGLEGVARLAAEHVLCTPGASAALHLHARARMQPGDIVLLPAPYWQNFERIYRRALATPFDVTAPSRPGQAPNLAELRCTYDALRDRHEAPRTLVLTNPHNPLGLVMGREELEAIASWVVDETEMDLVCDEIYAHSTFGSQVFASILSTRAALAAPDRIHAVWGFAKDLGLSGFMAGALLTRSEHLRNEIIQRWARLSPFDSLKNAVLSRMLAPSHGEPSRPGLRMLLDTYQKRLCEAHEAVAAALDAGGISRHRAAQGAPFFWLDLREHLDTQWPEPDHPAIAILDAPECSILDSREERLHKHLACRGNVVLLRGQSMRCPDPGFFRMCFTAQPTNLVLDAVGRICDALQLDTGRSV
jgi:aspartate/methionine/tyrosine aminotransferase